MVPGVSLFLGPVFALPSSGSVIHKTLNEVPGPVSRLQMKRNDASPKDTPLGDTCPGQPSCMNIWAPDTSKI